MIRGGFVRARLLVLVVLLLVGSLVVPAAATISAPIVPMAAGPQEPSVAATSVSSLTLRVSTETPKAGKRLAVSGQSRSVKVGSKILIQARRTGKKSWGTIKTTRLKRSGQFDAKVRLAAGGWDLRARVKGSRGPISDTVQISSLGQAAKVKLRKSTTRISPAKLTSIGEIGPDNRQVLILAPSAKLPKVGSVVVSTASKDGVLGRVVTVDRASRRVVLGPAALNEAYSQYRVSLAATLGDFVSSAPGSARLRAQALRALSKVEFKCESNLDPNGAPSLNFSGFKQTCPRWWPNSTSTSRSHGSPS